MSVKETFLYLWCWEIVFSAVLVSNFYIILTLNSIRDRLKDVSIK